MRQEDPQQTSAMRQEDRMKQIKQILSRVSPFLGPLLGLLFLYTVYETVLYKPFRPLLVPECRSVIEYQFSDEFLNMMQTSDTPLAKEELIPPALRFPNQTLPECGWDYQIDASKYISKDSGSYIRNNTKLLWTTYLWPMLRAHLPGVARAAVIKFTENVYPKISLDPLEIFLGETLLPSIKLPALPRDWYSDPRYTWTEMIARLGLYEGSSTLTRPCKAILTATSRILFWHTAQPIVWFLTADAYFADVPPILQDAVWWVSMKESAYLIGTIFAIFMARNIFLYNPRRDPSYWDICEYITSPEGFVLYNFLNWICFKYVAMLKTKLEMDDFDVLSQEHEWSNANVWVLAWKEFVSKLRVVRSEQYHSTIDRNIARSFLIIIFCTGIVFFVLTAWLFLMYLKANAYAAVGLMMCLWTRFDLRAGPLIPGFAMCALSLVIPLLRRIVMPLFFMLVRFDINKSESMKAEKAAKHQALLEEYKMDMKEMDKELMKDMLEAGKKMSDNNARVKTVQALVQQMRS